MDRRDFVKMLGGGTLASAVFPGLLRSEPATPRPNIFMIFGDDINKLGFGCYGNPVAQTPSIDRLASEGMRFENMFTASPSCAPSRAALFTGLYPIRNGAHANHSVVKPGTKSVAHYMDALGYRVILLGKRHAYPPDSFPFEFYRDDLWELGPGRDFLKILNDPGDKPLCIVMCKFEGHDPWLENDRDYDENAVDIPPYLVDTPEIRHKRACYYSNITKADEGIGKVLDALDASGLGENTITFFTTDHGTGWLHEKYNLYDAGINVPFIVRWPGRIQPGSLSDALASFVDIVPTFIELAGGEVDRVVDQCGGQPLDGNSLLPVLTGQSAKHHDAVHGCFTWEVIMPYPARAVRTATRKYIRNLDSQFVYPQYWAMNIPENVHYPLWKSIELKAQTDPVAASRIVAELYRPPEELYDIVADPHEIDNLAGDPRYLDDLRDLRARCDAWMRQQGDDGSSAYHGEEGKPRFLDTFYLRQKVVYASFYPLDGGVWTYTTRVELKSPLWEAAIHYTLDGSEPTRDSPLYTEMFTVTAPTVINARAFYDEGKTPVKTIELEALDYSFHNGLHFYPSNLW